MQKLKKNQIQATNLAVRLNNLCTVIMCLAKLTTNRVTTPTVPITGKEVVQPQPMRIDAKRMKNIQLLNVFLN